MQQMPLYGCEDMIGPAKVNEIIQRLEPAERKRVEDRAASLASVTEHDGTLYVLCFSDEGPETGPHPVGQKELKGAFNSSTGWNVAAIAPERVQTRFHDEHGAPAWLATIKRL